MYPIHLYFGDSLALRNTSSHSQISMSQKSNCDRHQHLSHCLQSNEGEETPRISYAKEST